MITIKDRVWTEYRINNDFVRPAKEEYKELKKFSSANICDCFYKRQALPYDIKPLYPECRKIVGPALTVQISPGDEIMALKAIYKAKPGDILVVSGGRSNRFSLWGGIMSLMAQKRGVAGLVTDSMVRDRDEIKEIDFPVYCTGHLPTAPIMDVPPGDLGFSIPFGNVIINPGDIVVGDEDGVVVVPSSEIQNVINAADYRIKKEEKWRGKITSGEKILEDNVNDLLRSRSLKGNL